MENKHQQLTASIKHWQINKVNNKDKSQTQHSIADQKISTVITLMAHVRSF